MPTPEEIKAQLVERIRNDFGYHPATRETIPQHESVRQNFLSLAAWVVEFVPAGRDQSLCLTALEEAAMRANKAIAMTAPLAH